MRWKQDNPYTQPQSSAWSDENQLSQLKHTSFVLLVMLPTTISLSGLCPKRTAEGLTPSLLRTYLLFPIDSGI